MTSFISHLPCNKKSKITKILKLEENQFKKSIITWQNQKTKRIKHKWTRPVIFLTWYIWSKRARNLTAHKVYEIKTCSMPTRRNRKWQYQVRNMTVLDHSFLMRFVIWFCHVIMDFPNWFSSVNTSWGSSTYWKNYFCIIQCK